MSLRKLTPCDLKIDGQFICPYGAESMNDCEYYCGADEPEDDPDDFFYTDDYDDYVDGEPSLE